MKRLLLVAIAVVGLSGCNQRIADLETRVTALETEHNRTREKLQALLKWVNPIQGADVGLMEWIDAIHAEVYNQPGDHPKPALPPQPF